MGAVRRDCKEKEELIQRVLESGARALLPDLELDEMVIADDDSDSAEAEADGSSDGEASEQSPEPPAEEDNSAQPAAEEPGAEAEAGTAAPEEPEEPAEEAEVSENWRTRAEAAAAAAAGTAAPAAEESKVAQSKVAQSKVLEGEGGSSAAETAPEAPAPAAAAPAAAAAAAAAAPAAEYTKEKLMSDLGTVQMMGEMGLANQMMEVLTRITFGLADEDRDGQISRPEATAFATTHLRDGQPLVATLGIRGGALRLDDAAAVEQVVGAAFAACDANADNLVNSSEARATPCRKHMYELLVSAPQPAAAKPAAAAPAQPAAQPAGGAAAGAKDAWSDMFKNLGEKGAADRGGMSKPHPLFAQFERRLKRAQATLMRNLHDPNFNTFLAGLGVCAMLLQQAPASPYPPLTRPPPRAPTREALSPEPCPMCWGTPSRLRTTS